MLFLERDMSLTDEDDYELNVRERAIEYKAVEVTPVRFEKEGQTIVIGWLLRHKMLHAAPLQRKV